MGDFLDGIDAFLATFSAEELRVSRAAFQRLLTGHPLPVAAVPDAADVPASVAGAAVARLVERGTMALDRAGRAIVAARGLSLDPTPHRLALDGRALYAFCAIDAVGIPAGLEVDARIESRCRGCQAPVALTLTRGVAGDAPAGMVIWAAERDERRPLHEFT